LLLPAISSYRLIGGAVLFAMWNCAMLVYYFHLVNRHILFGRLIEMLRMSPLPFGLLCMLCMGLPSLFVPGNIRFIIFIVCAILYLRLGFRLMKSTVILGHA